MPSAQLSPKKYIQTKARTLPVYKCLVNKDWKEASEASVMVIRRHVNGNITAGIYLVDLLCIGIKDTFYFFNEAEQDIYKGFPADMKDSHVEIDYALAHNIIYAGYDFAMEFGIEPNKEFAITKFILDEDNDAIPLIDIHVGDNEGLPHLVVYQPGEWGSALAKLQKNAGEGNYRYTVTGFPDDDDFEDEDDDDEFETTIEEYELGRITPREAAFLSDNELADFDKTEERTYPEKMTMLTEEALRRYRRANAAYYDKPYDESGDELMEKSEGLAYGITASELDTFFDSFEDEILKADAGKPAEESNLYFQDLLDKHADKLLVMTAVFESEWNSNGTLTALAKSRLEDLQIYPLAKLELALANLLEAAPTAGFDDMYKEPDIEKLFPEMDVPGQKDISVFWLLQTVWHLLQNDLEKAVSYYEQFSEIDVISFMAPAVQIKLTEAINETLKK